MSALERIVADAETYWDTDYTLTKLSTSEYVRDNRFECQGFSILRESEAFKPRFVRGYDLVEYFKTVDWSKIELIAHNGLFDFLILAERYGVIPARYVCTQSLARYVFRGKVRHSVEALAKHFKLQGKLDGLLDVKGKHMANFTDDDWAKLEPYAIHDAKLELYYYLKLIDQVPPDERELMDITFRGWTQPMLEVDLPLAREALADAEKLRADKIGAAGVDISILRSREKFANLLREMGIDPPMKKSKTTGKPTYAFARNDEAFLELLEHQDDTVRDLVEAKMESSSNIAITRAQRLIKMGETGKLAVALHTWGAKTTLRDSGANKMNMQNFKRRSKLRRAIRAPDDHVLVIADQSNIECRMNAWFWDQHDTLEIFRVKGDVYNDMGTAIYGRPIDRKLKLLDGNGNEYLPMFTEGFVGKTTVLSLGYGAGAIRLRHALATGNEAKVKLSLDECYGIVHTYRSKNWCIAGGWEIAREWLSFMANGTGQIKYKCITIDADNHKIWGPDGTFLYYPGLEEDGGQFTYIDQGGAETVYIYGAKLVENIIQWLSRMVVMDNVRTIHRAGHRVVGRVHDEILACVKKSDAQRVLDFVLKTMRTSPVWAPDLPLDADGAYDVCYSK